MSSRIVRKAEMEGGGGQGMERAAATGHTPVLGWLTRLAGWLTSLMAIKQLSTFCKHHGSDLAQ
jgi:hypothetical protein